MVEGRNVHIRLEWTSEEQIAIGLVNDDMEIVRRISIPFPYTGRPATAELIYEHVTPLLSATGKALSDVASIWTVVQGSIDPASSIIIDTCSYKINRPISSQTLIRAE